MSYDHYARDPRAHGQQPLRSATGEHYGQAHLRDVPRYDPTTVPLLTIPDVLAFNPPRGAAGTTFSVQVTDISNDPRQYRFVFGQRRIGAFLERARSDNGSSILVAQVPRKQDCGWWSDTVPVYLVVADPETDEAIHQAHVCEFEFSDEAEGPRKRARDDDLHGRMHMGSPLKRPNSQPSLPPSLPTYGAVSRQDPVFPTQSYAQHGISTGMFPRYEEQERHTQVYDYRNPSVRVPFSAAPPAAPAWTDHLGPQTYTAYGRRQEPSPQSRYVALPRDQYAPQQARYSEEPAPYYHGSGGRAEAVQMAESASVSSTMYQSSLPSSTTAWKSPQQSGPSNFYNSPPPSSTLSKAEASLDSTLMLEDSTTPGSAPMLKRTSTLSSVRSTSAKVATPASTPADWMHSNQVKLEVLGNLEDMARNWSVTEFSTRRRLVQFWRQQDTNIVRVNFRPLEPGAARSPNAVTISCIYWEERQECYFTSIDAIILLQHLVGNKFLTDEKNRTRRNLEGFKPETVSKARVSSEAFFKLIMGLPAPKPRNIEKDFKVFPWKILTSALRKVLSKYSASFDGLVERNAGASTDGHAQLYSVDQMTPTPSSVDMPPPVLNRGATTESSDSAAHEQQDYVEADAIDLQSRSPPRERLHEGMPAPPPLGHSQIDVKSDRPTSPSSRGTSAAGLSIQVPQPGGNLPILEGADGTATTSSFDDSHFRRPSIPQTADFMDFFQSPSNQPSTTSGWPILPAVPLFPPPSAGFGPENQFPRKA